MCFLHFGCYFLFRVHRRKKNSNAKENKRKKRNRKRETEAKIARAISIILFRAYSQKRKEKKNVVAALIPTHILQQCCAKELRLDTCTDSEHTKALTDERTRKYSVGRKMGGVNLMLMSSSLFHFLFPFFVCVCTYLVA